MLGSSAMQQPMKSPFIGRQSSTSSTVHGPCQVMLYSSKMETNCNGRLTGNTEVQVRG
jgi:hypothetical protein